MFDIGFTELLVIGVVALIVVGPKDLPAMFRTLGRFTARARALGREFTSAMNAAADESGMRDAAKDLKSMTSPRTYGLDKLNEAADRFDKWDPTKPSAKDGAKAEDGKTPAKPVDPERQADIDKIRAATEKAGQARLDREAAARAEAEAGGEPAQPAAGATAAKPAAKATTPKKAPAKAQAAKPTAPKKAAPKKAAPKKPAAGKTVKSAAKTDKANDA
jgi:sec-independent protein translocase protein TatB